VPIRLLVTELYSQTYDFREIKDRPSALIAPDLDLTPETGFQVSSGSADFCQCPLGGGGASRASAWRCARRLSPCDFMKKKCALISPLALGEPVLGMFYYCEAASEQRAARCIVATGVLLERGLPRDAESLHPRACMGVPSAKLMRELQNLLPRADHTEAHA
jgi:hypothetical protein